MKNVIAMLLTIGAFALVIWLITLPTKWQEYIFLAVFFTFMTVVFISGIIHVFKFFKELLS